MAGRSRDRSTTTTNQQQSSSTSLGSTPFAMPFLPQYSGAAQNAANMGGYTGDIVAAPTQQANYAPDVPDVSGFVADPGAPLEDYTPDVQILDRYIQGASPTSRDGLADAIGWAASQGGQVQSTAANLGDYWNRVSSGEFLDPNTNTALQSYLATMSEGARDEFDRGAQQFRSEAIDSGAFGGTGYGRGMAWGLDEFNENDLAQRAAVLYQNYGDEMDRIARSGAGAQDAFTLGMLPGQAMMSLGDIERGYDQLDINDTLARNQEIERGQSLDILDAERQRQDAALRAQAGLDNENALARWNIYQQQNQIQDDVMRGQVDQMIRQAGLTNDAAAWDAERWGEMDAWERYFGGLANPVFGENSEGTMTGTSTTTTEQRTPAWQQALGALSAGAQMWGAFTNPAMAAAGAAAGGTTNGGVQPSSGVSLQPIQMPQINYGQYFSSVPSGSGNSGIPWYLQQMYNQQPPVSPGG